MSREDFPEQLTFFTGLIVLDCNDLKYIMDFKSLGRFTFNPYILEFFDTVGSEAFGEYGFFDVRLYRNLDRMTVPLTMEPGTLKLMTTVDLDPRYVYHIQISLRGNWLTIPSFKWEGLRRYPHVFWQMCRFFGVCKGHEDFNKMELLGVGRDRTVDLKWPGEGTTKWTADLEDVCKTGYVKMADINCGRVQRGNTIPEETSPGGGGGGMIGRDLYGPTNQLLAGIISDKRKNT